jgi:hypothetical protein
MLHWITYYFTVTKVWHWRCHMLDYRRISVFWNVGYPKTSVLRAEAWTWRLPPRCSVCSLLCCSYKPTSHQTGKLPAISCNYWGQLVQQPAPLPLDKPIIQLLEWGCNALLIFVKCTKDTAVVWTGGPREFTIYFHISLFSETQTDLIPRFAFHQICSYGARKLKASNENVRNIYSASGVVSPVREVYVIALLGLHKLICAMASLWSQVCDTFRCCPPSCTKH